MIKQSIDQIHQYVTTNLQIIIYFKIFENKKSEIDKILYP